ncbi:hypothetical protein BDD12DRAFT_876322 [Trichophaea hybrida]|nr:hypothetical protein BDD12DRAFT_879524 [Trichophaea hybrida]KAF8542542.1 hypothetical protein BDD12DRAFT_876322 [Trichophaea hybrida]
MWLLECDDKEAFGSKRLWLRPGSRCVLGRVKQGEVTVTVPSSRTISRTHLIINIANVNEEDGVKILTRSQITMQDNNTKHGTTVNGQNITGNQISLDSGDVHTFFLGSMNMLSGAEDKNVMAPYRAKVEALDVKTIAAWTPSTTHVVASKRNTAIGLQALVNGRFIVTSSYLDAIAQAAALPLAGPSGEQPMSPLEIDFDANWPKPEDFLPPPLYEPVTKSAEAYSPDPRRKNIFDGWTFVFCEDVQYQNLLGPITDAQGKPEKFALEPKVTSPEELADFIRKRGDGSEVALVKFRAKNESEWDKAFTAKIQELLGYRMVEQNEFLEIILSCDTATLRRPLEAESLIMQRSLPQNEPEQLASGASILVPETRTKQQKPTSEPTVTTSAPARTRGRVRRRGVTPVDPFAFDMGGDFLPAPTPDPATQFQTQSLEKKGSQTVRAANIPDPLSNTNEHPTPMEVEEEAQLPTLKPPIVSRTSPRKRRAPIPPEPDEDEGLDIMDLLPGSKIVKRRKVAEEEERMRRGNTVSPPEPNNPKESPKEEMTEKPESKRKGKKKGKPETSFETQAREIREKEAEQAEKAKAQEQTMMEGLDIEGLKNLAIVEVVKVKPRTDRPIRDVYGDESARWKPEWNGRNNFKKFKRAGRGSTTRSVAGPKVFVDLVESKGRDYGIGDGYWIENEENPSRKKNSQKNTQPANTPADTSLYTTARETAEPSEAESRPRRGRTQVSGSRLAAVAKSHGTKRPAPPQAVTGGGKKQKTLQIQSDDESSSDDSDDDDLKFKLPKRRK